MSRRALALLASGWLVACASVAPPVDPAPELEPESADFVQVVLYNRSPEPGPKRIYARWDGSTRRELGSLERGASLTLTLLVEGSNLRIEFYPAWSSTVSVIPGERIELILDASGVRSRRLPSRVRPAAGN